ncbi:MAG: hypothetical protein AAGA20_13800 [Planctomycetota bacterium]
MPSNWKLSPALLVFGLAVLSLYLVLEMSGLAFGGSKKPERVDPTQIRQAAPGSWTYAYWAHGSRGK